MEDFIIAGILIVAVVLSLLHAAKHFKGGGCCGSGQSTYRSKKKLSGAVQSTKTLIVEGMHCENCEARVENALNELDGVVCKASHRHKRAIVHCDRPVSDEQLREAVERAGYSVLSIQESPD